MENRTLRQALVRFFYIFSCSLARIRSVRLTLVFLFKCDVGFDCTSEVVTLLSTFVKGGGMMGKMAAGLLGNKIDIENIDTIVLAYYANMCDELEASTKLSGSKATKEQEL